VSTCGVCGTPLTPGMGHACFRPARVVQSGYDRAAELRERVDELRAWAKNRIAAAEAAIRAAPINATSTLTLVGEHRALTAVLRILDGGHV
jgi:hypothetical protein